MEVFKKSLEFAENISKEYQENYHSLFEDARDDILEIFRELFNEKNKEFELTTSNTSYGNIKLYEFHDRVKECKSLKEKVIRSDKFYDTKEQYEKIIFSFDDIIGIKVLTSLKDDCKKVHTLLEKNKSYLEERNIFIDFGKKQPRPMKNGKKLYKMKGIYIKDEKNYQFELQVKSHLESSWGDLEHILFYKDYDFEYIKENNKEIMNKIFNLLDNIDSLMLTIRNAKSDFRNSSIEYEFTKKVQTLIKEQFNDEKIECFDYHLDLGIKTAFNICNELIGKDNSLINKLSIKFDFNKQNSENIYYNNYTYFLDKCYTLYIAETIYRSVLNCSEKFKENYYEEVIEKLLKNIIKKSLISKIKKSTENNNANKISVEVQTEAIFYIYKGILETYTINNAENNLLVDEELVDLFISTYKIIQDIDPKFDDTFINIYDKYEISVSDSEDEDIELVFEKIKDYLVKKSFENIYTYDSIKGVSDTYMNEIKELFEGEQNEIKDKLDKILDEVNKRVKEKKDE